MSKSSLNRYVLVFLLLALIVSTLVVFKFFNTPTTNTSEPLTAASTTLDYQANIIWVENDAVVFKQFFSGVWHADEIIYRTTDATLYSAAVGAESDDRLIAVWSSQRENSTTLNFSLRDNSGKWSEHQQITDQTGENLDAQILFDSMGNCWVFWVSDEDGDDDIYMATRAAGKWSPYVKLNLNNDVPDISPRARLQSDGNIELTWRSFDRTTASYVKQSQLIEAPNVGANTQPKTETLVSDIKLSQLAISGKRVYVHFPNNTSQQSTILDTR